MLVGYFFPVAVVPCSRSGGAVRLEERSPIYIFLAPNNTSLPSLKAEFSDGGTASDAPHHCDRGG